MNPPNCAPLRFVLWHSPSPPCTFCGCDMGSGLAFNREKTQVCWCNECSLVIGNALLRFNESPDGGVGQHRVAALIQAERERAEASKAMKDSDEAAPGKKPREGVDE